MKADARQEMLCAPDVPARGFTGALSVVAELAAVTSCVESPGAGTQL